jgi:hypothetical protein
VNAKNKYAEESKEKNVHIFNSKWQSDAFFCEISENWLERIQNRTKSISIKMEIILKIPGTHLKDKQNFKYLTSAVQSFGVEKRVAKIIV